jgi:hypothetical protein
MGCKTNKEQTISDIIYLSNNKITEQDIEEIMMNTQCKQ